MKLSAQQWEALFKAYMDHVSTEEGTDFLWLSYQVLSVANAAGVDAHAFTDWVEATHQEQYEPSKAAS